MANNTARGARIRQLRRVSPVSTANRGQCTASLPAASSDEGRVVAAEGPTRPGRVTRTGSASRNVRRNELCLRTSSRRHAHASACVWLRHEGSTAFCPCLHRTIHRFHTPRRRTRFEVHMVVYLPNIADRCREAQRYTNAQRKFRVDVLDRRRGYR